MKIKDTVYKPQEPLRKYTLEMFISKFPLGQDRLTVLVLDHSRTDRIEFHLDPKEVEKLLNG